MADTNGVLVVDDDADLCATLAEALQASGINAQATTSASEAKKLVADADYDSVLLDLELGAGVTGLQLCREIAVCRPELPVVIITGHDGLDNVVSAIRAGAFDFIRKPVALADLGDVVSRAARVKRRRQPQRLEDSTPLDLRPVGIIGESPAMKRLFSDIEKVSRADTTVVINGETGTGKELVARAIHNHSDRAGEPFVALNCAAMSSALLESELFGHVKGAFTDARRRREGLFVSANGGTLFLDEIGEMSLDMQAKLLRALQNRRVRAVGGTTEVSVDVRLVAATNRDLEVEVANGTFREDVYYRINVVPLTVPPLRDRDRDVVLIARYILDQRFEDRDVVLAPKVEKKLCEYDWPGNVRELENVLTRASALVSGEVIELEHLPRHIRRYVPKSNAINGGSSTMLPTLEEVEQRYIAHVLELVDGNKTSASKILGMNRRTLYRKLARFAAPE